ncbi:hypothetical protein [Pontibacter liquoris]|uniref:hypothetical protein n=1 Tax=Pontibacter liquoris TaxID=2905677 RepID=UPI001FA78AD2|nr:hypothetical protein [Pontibacter liquoris]
MKSILYLALFYLCLLLLVVSCTEKEPEPACLQAEVVGADCQNGWYVLRLLEENSTESHKGDYVGQIQSGYVTTDNLPEAYRQTGKRLNVALELNGEYSPRCVAVHMMYPAVRITRVCSSASGN